MRPRYIAYIIWLVIALMGVICWLVPQDGFVVGEWTLRWPTLTEALDMEDSHASELIYDIPLDSAVCQNNGLDTIPPADTVPMKDSIVQMVTPVVPTVNLEQIETRTYLSAFYQALDSANVMPMRVVHYGDSQIEEDRITNILRELWQKAYGGGGVGLIPLHQTIPTRTIHQHLTMDGVVQPIKGGPKRYIIYGPRAMRLDSDKYGVMGQVAMMDTALVESSEDIVMHIEPMSKKLKSHNYFSRVRIMTDTAYLVQSIELTTDSGVSCPFIDTPCDQQSMRMLCCSLPDSSTTCQIHLQGKGAIYGVSLETETGVMVDNIPMRGCSGNIFTRIDSTMLSQYYAVTNTRLIILQFGGNMIPQTENPSTITGYVKTLRQQVRYIRACAPYASILFIGPSDMSTRIDGEMMTYPLVPYLDKLLKKMAQEEQIAYWSMYEAMGGYNSMVQWVENGLAGSDYVHFTRSGANKVGRMLSEWIAAGR